MDHTFTTKTAKITSLENLYVYGIGQRHTWIRQLVGCYQDPWPYIEVSSAIRLSYTLRSDMSILDKVLVEVT